MRKLMLSLAGFRSAFGVISAYRDVATVVTGPMGVSGRDNLDWYQSMVLRCTSDIHTMSRRCDSLDTSHSDSEGSLDSTARSKWYPDIGDSEGGPFRIPNNRIPLNLAE
ncbi:Uncharacterized protein TCM_043125 [Theobroma cacao]|uniref:Uncharacterized protein n=1 Tax=Theobroma cacao TaxID=3641 RepID=A0A061FMS8_THECC|nr:Uncharacterized protein TCM_043125 [Theobroma cacao]